MTDDITRTRTTATATANATSEWEKCIHCKEMKLSKGLRTHVILCQVIMAEAAKSKNTDGLVKCCYCEYRFKPQELVAHQPFCSNFKKGKGNKWLWNWDKKEKLSTAGFVTCQYCNELKNPVGLVEHQKHYCRVASEEAAKSSDNLIGCHYCDGRFKPYEVLMHKQLCKGFPHPGYRRQPRFGWRWMWEKKVNVVDITWGNVKKSKLAVTKTLGGGKSPSSRKKATPISSKTKHKKKRKVQQEDVPAIPIHSDSYSLLQSTKHLLSQISGNNNDQEQNTNDDESITDIDTIVDNFLESTDFIDSNSNSDSDDDDDDDNTNDNNNNDNNSEWNQQMEAGGLLLTLCTIRCEVELVEKLLTYAHHNRNSNSSSSSSRDCSEGSGSGDHIFQSKYREFQFMSAYDIAFYGRNKSLRLRSIFDLFRGQLSSNNNNKVYRPPGSGPDLLKTIPGVIRRYLTNNGNNRGSSSSSKNNRLLSHIPPTTTGGYFKSSPSFL